jgi:hypothetical protein
MKPLVHRAWKPAAIALIAALIVSNVGWYLRSIPTAMSISFARGENLWRCDTAHFEVDLMNVLVKGRNHRDVADLLRGVSRSHEVREIGGTIEAGGMKFTFDASDNVSSVVLYPECKGSKFPPVNGRKLPVRSVCETTKRSPGFRSEAPHRRCPLTSG